MIQVINGLYIKNKSILIVRKNEYWTLPGGKKEKGEDDTSCLKREICEELSGQKIDVGEKMGVYAGVSPTSKSSITVSVYLIICLDDNDCKFVPSAEIIEAKMVPLKEMKNYNLSDVTKEIMKNLEI